MKTLSSFAIALSIAGCAASPFQNTKAFYAEEDEVARTCLAPIAMLAPAARLVVDKQTGRSPLTSSAWCYSNQIRAVVRLTSYQHAGMVNDYADYLTRLTAARDAGLVDTTAALAGYKQVSALFRQAIANADQRLVDASRRELADRFSAFAHALSNLAAEQDRQRLAKRPTNCFLTGIYQTTGITCI